MQHGCKRGSSAVNLSSHSPNLISDLKQVEKNTVINFTNRTANSSLWLLNLHVSRIFKQEGHQARFEKQNNSAVEYGYLHTGVKALWSALYQLRRLLAWWLLNAFSINQWHWGHCTEQYSCQGLAQNNAWTKTSEDLYKVLLYSESFLTKLWYSPNLLLPVVKLYPHNRLTGNKIYP